MVEDLVLDLSSYTGVRAAFRSRGGAWSALPEQFDRNPLSATTWTVCHEGKRLGTVRTVPGRREAIAEAGMQRLVPGQMVPRVGPVSLLEFVGWSGHAVHRPLPATTASHCSDPDGWETSALPNDVRASLVAAFRKSTPQLSGCAKDGSPIPYPLADDEVRARTVLRSRSGEFVVVLAVEPRGRDLLSACDGSPEIGWAPHLFRIDVEKHVSFLGAALTVVDFGDFDGDGHSEVIAKRESYDLDGYVLFSRDFLERTSFEWHYH